jgi:hypothetical protein
VLTHIHQWLEAGLHVPRISINASVEQFRDSEFGDHVIAWPVFNNHLKIHLQINNLQNPSFQLLIFLVFFGSND